MRFKINRIDEKYEPYEFMLVWDGQNGEQLFWLFLDFENRFQVSTTQTKQRKQLIDEYNHDINLFAEGVEPKDKPMFNDLMLSQNAYRLFKDGTTQSVNIINMNMFYRQSNQLIDVSCTINYDSRSQ